MTIDEYRESDEARRRAQKALDAAARRRRENALRRYVEERRRSDARREMVLAPFRLARELLRVAGEFVGGSR